MTTIKDYSADLLFMLLKREKNRAFLENLMKERYSKNSIIILTRVLQKLHKKGKQKCRCYGFLMFMLF